MSGLAGETGAARRRMLAFAALTGLLAPGASASALGARLLAFLRDDVEAFAAYRRHEGARGAPDEEGWRLLLQAGWSGPPPARTSSIAGLCGDGAARAVPDRGAIGPFVALGRERPDWIGPHVRALAPVAGGARGVVLFALRDQTHPASLAALLELCAQRILDALAEGAGGARQGEPEPGLAPGAGAPDATRVLLIDDEELLVAHVRRILERAGCVFHAARSAHAGFALAQAIRPDVILIDKVLPDQDGVRLLRRMRRDDALRTVPVIVLSGRADEAARVAALEEGADDVVTKPFSTRDLVARIEANVRLVRLRRDAVWRQGELVRLQQSQQELRKLLDTVQRVRADERRMLAREVHDQLGQILTAAKIDLRLLQKRLADRRQAVPAARVAAELGTAVAGVDLALAAVQDIAALLRPPELEEGGLVGALRWQADDLQRRTGIECTVRHQSEGYVEQPPFVAGELLRMCQEALTNVLRHAGASRILIQVVMRNACLLVRICDDGAGIPRARLHDPSALGLKGMRERAAGIGAAVHVYGRRGRGTMVAIRRRLVFL